MAAVTEETAKTWDEFRQFVSRPFTDEATAELWRGQGDSSWPLASVLERTIIEHHSPNERIYPYGRALSGAASQRFWEEFEKFRVQYIERFGQEVIALGHELPNEPERHRHLEALGRHHGLARLQLQDRPR